MKTQQSYNTLDAGAETPVWRWKSSKGGRAGNKHLTQREAAVRNSEAVQRPV